MRFRMRPVLLLVLLVTLVPLRTSVVDAAAVNTTRTSDVDVNVVAQPASKSGSQRVEKSGATSDNTSDTATTSHTNVGPSSDSASTSETLTHGVSQATSKNDESHALSNPDRSDSLPDIPGIPGALDETALHLPPLMKHMLASALSGMDRASGGLLSELKSNSVEFAYSKDGRTLIARLHIPSSHSGGEAKEANRKLYVAILGQSHMRVRTEMMNGPFRTSSVHTIRLPVRVSSDGVTISPAPDGSVHVRMSVLQDGQTRRDGEEGESESDGTDDPSEAIRSFFQRQLGMPMLPVLISRRIPEISKESGKEAIEEIPSSMNILRCRQEYGDDALRRRNCLCGVTPSLERKAVCYAELISKCVRIARRLKMDDFATSTKHIALDCAEKQEEKTKCLGEVAGQVIERLGSEGGGGENENEKVDTLKDQIRTAIEREDNGPSNFQPSVLGILLRLLLIGMLLVLFFGCGLIYILRNRVIGNRAQGMVNQLTSVLAQSSSTSKVETSSSPSRKAGANGSAGVAARSKSAGKIS